MNKKKRNGQSLSRRKMKWGRPMLTILTRAEDKQEKILLGCKVDNNEMGFLGPHQGAARCLITGQIRRDLCQWCNAFGTS